MKVYQDGRYPRQRDPHQNTEHIIFYVKHHPGSLENHVTTSIDPRSGLE